MATIYELKKLAAEYGLNKTLREIIKLEKGDMHKCPQCKGKGYIYESYNAYPKGLPDSDWVTDMRLRKSDCDLCNGKGYTVEKYKAKYRTVLDGYEKE